MKHAVIKCGGRQYIVKEGTQFSAEKVDVKKDGNFKIESVLLIFDDKNIEIGTPYIPKKYVEVSVINHGRDDKKIIFRYHSKTRYRKTKGHRQPNVLLKVLKIA